MIYAFDVDGTLTPSRGLIDARFQLWFTRFCRTHTVCLVTGSDHEKTREQLGDLIVNSCTYTLNCSGADIYYYGKPWRREEWTCPDDLWLWLENQLYSSPYRHRYGRHFEARPGMLNFSVVGRGAQGSERTSYYSWDCVEGERASLAAKINDRWPDICARVGGETGIDIGPRGLDKSRLLDLTGSEPVSFFGDRCDDQGNDWPLSSKLQSRPGCEVHHVNGWEETWDILKQVEEINYEYDVKFSRQRVKGDSTHAVGANR